MSTFHLQARARIAAQIGTHRDVTRSAAADRRADLDQLVDELVDQGFTVWIFVHGRAGLTGASDLVVDEVLRPRRDCARIA